MNSTNKYLLTLFGFLFFATSLQSQNTAIDSLTIELQNHKKRDTIRVNFLNELAFSYYRKDIAKTKAYLDESIVISEAIDFKKGKGRSLYIKGIAQIVQSNFDEALESFNEALELYESINFKSGIANCYGGMGMVYKNKGDQRKSIAYYKKSIKIDEARGDKDVSANMINLGNVYVKLGEYENALTHFKKALTINEENKNIDRVSACLNSIGVIYSNQGNYPLALEYYNKSLFIDKNNGDSLGMAQTLNNVGVIYKNQEKYAKAIECYNDALKICENIKSKKGIALLLNNIGDIYKGKEEYAIALNFYTEALDVSKKIGFKGNISTCSRNIGDVYLQLNDNVNAHRYYQEAKRISIEIEEKRNLSIAFLGIAKVYANQEKYNKAIFNALKSKDLSTKLELIKIQRDVHKLLSEIYNSTYNYKKAFENQQQYKLLNDSLFNKENIEKIAQIEYEYKYKQALDSASIRELKLTQEVVSTTIDLEKSQRSLLLGVIGFLILVLLSGAIIFSLKIKNEKSKTQNIVIEQKLLRSQMTPHFMFNSLSVLQGMILNKEENISILYLSKFSKLLRTTLENSRHKMVSLSEEISAIDSYMALQDLDVSPPYAYNFTIDAAIDKTIFKIPPMLIQPFIENAVEHAFITNKENKEIDVQLTFNDQVLTCTITDNGNGIKSNQPEIRKNKKSLATTITSERLKILAKEFGVQSSISIQNRKLFGEQGTLVTLDIPYKIDAA